MTPLLVALAWAFGPFIAAILGAWAFIVWLGARDWCDHGDEW